MTYARAYKLLYFIVKRFRQEFRRSPNRTELIKMLYLTDLEYYKNFGQKYSEFNYIFYNFGPWTKQFHQLLDYMVNEEISESKKSSDKEYWCYSLTDRKPRHEIDLENEITEALNNTLFIYKESDLIQILKVVYTTEPMASTERNEEIDFQKLPLNARVKRLKYRENREKNLKKLTELENQISDENRELEESKLYRDRVNRLLWQEP